MLLTNEQKQIIRDSKRFSRTKNSLNWRVQALRANGSSVDLNFSHDFGEVENIGTIKDSIERWEQHIFDRFEGRVPEKLHLYQYVDIRKII